jgi:hypothetical protein
MKSINETHPSLGYLTLADNSLDGSNIETYGEYLTKTLMLDTGIITTSVGLIQKHTIDKTVLKELIRQNKMDVDELRWNNMHSDWNNALLLIENIIDKVEKNE